MPDRMRIAGCIGALSISIAGNVAIAAERPAITLLQSAIAAQGGEAALRSIKTLRVKTDGYRNMLEQSERPEGPYIVEFQRVTVEHDVTKHRWRARTESSIPPFADYAAEIVADDSAAMRVRGANKAPGNADLLTTTKETMALSPARLLLTALDAGDVALGTPATIQSVPQDVVRFSLDGAPVTLFLNRFTHLPTAVDYAGPLARDGYWRFVGDAPMRTYFSSWLVGDRGIRLPMQWDVERGPLREATYMVRSLQIDAPLADADMAIPEDIRAKFAAAVAAPPAGQQLGFPGQPPVELAPGITLIPGPWNVTLVRQEDGLVILEAPISSAYSELVIAEAGRRYPGVPIKAIVSTSDSWPHLAGIRPYAARGIPIYCLDLNQPALQRLIDARFDGRADALTARPRPAAFKPLSTRTVLGTGANRIELMPIRGETSERQLLAWFPGSKLLYGSDPFQQGGDGKPTSVQAASEVIDAAHREHLSPDRFFMMHIGAAPWAELEAWMGTNPGSFPRGSAQ
jgi:hypothetical protein